MVGRHFFAPLPRVAGAGFLLSSAPGAALFAPRASPPACHLLAVPVKAAAVGAVRRSLDPHRQKVPPPKPNQPQGTPSAPAALLQPTAVRKLLLSLSPGGGYGGANSPAMGEACGRFFFASPIALGLQLIRKGIERCQLEA